MSLIEELKRRNVFKVGAAYLALGWIVTQVTGVVVSALNLPAAINAMVVWMGIAGFPFVVFFAWAFELTPEGLKRESEIDRSQSITQLTSRRLDMAIIVLLVVAIALFVLDRVFPGAAAPDSSIVAGDGVGGTSAAGTRTARDASAEDDAPGAVVQADRAEAALAPDDKSIAVLPFADMSQAKDQEYFSDGIAEELLNALARIPELKVIARTSSFAFKGKEADIADIARKLNVAHVLEGSVRKAGNRVRITAQLIRTADSTHLWSQTYDRSLDDIFAVQDEIAGAVVEQLKVALLGAAPKVKQENPEAYALALQARHFASYGTVAGYKQALALYEQALALEPAYPRALVGMSNVYIGQGALGKLSPADANRKAREAVDQALTQDPLFAPAHTTLGSQIMESGTDLAAAAQHYQRALELAPGDPVVLGNTVGLLTRLGKLDRAVEIAAYGSSRDPVSAVRHSSLGQARYFAGDWDGAIASMRTVSALTPGASSAQYFIALALLAKGDATAALTEIATETDEEYRVKASALALHSLGRRAEFDKALAELTERWGAQWPSEVAQVYAWSGNADQAFAWLDKAVAQKEDGLTQQFLLPVYAPIHADPRWQAFRERTGTSEAQQAAVAFDVRLPAAP